ncbi:MAG: DNA polymerase III subunit epsilon [Gammaproteobacteria bacterium]|nr:DNA polymerase III subunit epsilon [Gammaproteobacteria bacterium]
MRQVVLDTETTGLDPAEGHRIIEIGCVEMVDRRLSNNHFRRYLNPEREVEQGALDVHGIDNAFLADKPRFADIAEDFLRFVDGAELVIHNAAFDIGFINHELRRMGGTQADITMRCRVLDTLELARRLHPGQKNSLDALCKRYSVDNSGRDCHGALLDAQLLAEVYLAMTGGQAALLLDDSLETGRSGNGKSQRIDRDGLHLKVIHASQEELREHQQRIEAIDKISGGKCVWRD